MSSIFDDASQSVDDIFYQQGANTMNLVIKKYMRRILCIVMVFVLMCGQSTVYAALQDGDGDGTGPSIGFGDIISACEISEYRAGKEYDEYTYPTKEGYVFAGWYTNATFETPISKDTKSGKYFPKFVDESVLTLRLQLTENTAYHSSQTNLRLITSVDNLKYASIGFVINGAEKISKTVYQTIKGYTKNGTSSYKPDEVFHRSSDFFATCTLENATNDVENHGKGDLFGATVTIVPQWTTLDGTIVAGQEATFEINDFLYESELEGESHFWGTLSENLERTSACTEDVQIKLLQDATIQADSSYAASISAGKDVTVTVNGNGKTISTNGESDIFSVESSEGEIDWKNVSIEHQGRASLFDLNGDCDITFNKVSITGKAEQVVDESAIISTGEHCTGAHITETITETQRTIADTVEKTDTYKVSTGESLVTSEQDKTVNITMKDSDINVAEVSGMAVIRVMRGTIAHINISDSTIASKDVLPLYVTGSDVNYPTWRGMAYITADNASVFTQGGVAVTTADIKANNAGMVALQEYTNRVIILADTHWMPEEDQEGSYIFHDENQGFSLGHTQGDRMRNIYLDVKFFNNRQKVDSVFVLGDLGNDDYPKNKIGINDDGTFADITQNYVYKFKNNLMSKFQSEMGITSSWALAGNHDSYTNSQWNEIMGYDRQYAKEIGNAVFIMLDTYQTSLGEAGPSTYSGIDLEWLRAQLDANTSWIGKPIFLCSHYYRHNTNSEVNASFENALAVQELLTEYEALGYQFVSMFYGHIHKTAIRYVFSGKKMPILVTGGYAYNTEEEDYDAFYDHSAWGFGVLEWNENEAHYYHVKYDRTYVSTAEDKVTDSIVPYGGAIENEIFISY